MRNTWIKEKTSTKMEGFKINKVLKCYHVTFLRVQEPLSCRIATLNGGHHVWNSFTHWCITVVGQTMIVGPKPSNLHPKHPRRKSQLWMTEYGWSSAKKQKTKNKLKLNISKKKTLAMEIYWLFSLKKKLLRLKPSKQNLHNPIRQLVNTGIKRKQQLIH